MRSKLSLVGCCVMLTVACAPARFDAPPAARPASAASAEPAPTPVEPAQQRFVEISGYSAPSVDLEERRRAASELESRLAALLDGAPGVAIGLVDRSGLIHSITRGTTNIEGTSPISTDTRFELGSVTKLFTATAALALVRKGVLVLDSPADQYLPALTGVLYPTRDSPRFTIRQLLSHTSGLPRIGPFSYTSDQAPSHAEVLGALRGLPLVRAPGTRYEYSNLGYTVLAQIIRAVRNQTYESYVEQQVLRPLKLSASFSAGDAAATGYSRSGTKLRVEKSKRRGGAAGSGGLWASLNDLAGFASWQLRAWPASSTPDSGPLSKAERRLSQTASWSLPARSRERGGRKYLESRAVGLGWQLYQRCDHGRVAWHNGSTNGFAAAVYLAIDAGLGVVVLANLRDARVDEMARETLSVLFEQGVLRADPEQPGPALLAAAREAVDLYNEWDEARYTKLFSEGFRKILPAKAMAAALEAKRAKLGACQALPKDPAQLRDTVAQVDGPDHVVFRLDCERAQPLMIAHGTAFGSPQLDLWVVDPGRSPLEQGGCGSNP